jgi:HlyD family secretion protein
MYTKFVIAFISIAAMVSFGCRQAAETNIQGKIKRETVAFAPKVTGRILKLYVQEGQSVSPGDTLAMLDVPELAAKMDQAAGAVKSSSAQHQLANNGVTINQMKQLEARQSAAQDQYDLAQKSYARANAMFGDSLLSPQAHDEAFANLQGAKAQLDAATAALTDAQVGTRFETKLATAGQAQQANGMLQEIRASYSERYIIATNYMSLETIALHVGELATAGYPVFNGYIPNSTWFRFTIPESHIAPYHKGEILTVTIPYNKQHFTGRILTIKQMPRYADITTAYPDYGMDDAIYELKIAPDDSKAAEGLLYNATILLEKPH